MFSFFKKKAPSADTTPALEQAENVASTTSAPQAEDSSTPAAKTASVGGWLRNTFGISGKEEVPSSPAPEAFEAAPEPQAKPTLPADRGSWMDRLKAGLRKTGTSITSVFTGTKIDDALYEELEDALLMADTGVKATMYLLEDLKRRVKETIQSLYDMGYRHFISGGALGMDMFAAEAVLELRAQHPDMILEMVSPFDDQAAK